MVHRQQVETIKNTVFKIVNGLMLTNYHQYMYLFGDTLTPLK